MTTLKELNFEELIKLDRKNINDYSFSEYKEKNCEHPKIVSYCTDCEEKGIKICEDTGFRLRNISHGSEAEDIINSIDPKLNTENWHRDGVMFIMESPSVSDDIFQQTIITKCERSFDKSPAKQWYWIHDEQPDIKGYPQNFEGRKYGGFIASAIVTFELKNAYITNLIKCGLNDDSNKKYKGIKDYHEACIKNCTEKFLINEIKIVKPKVIFTFGTRVCNWVNMLLKEWNFDIQVVGLPHPARARGGFSNEYYNVLYFCMIAKWLYKESVIDKEFYIKLMMKFSENNEVE